MLLSTLSWIRNFELHKLISVQPLVALVLLHPLSPSFDQPRLPLLPTQIAQFNMHHTVFGINFLLQSINLILTILLHTLLIPLMWAHLSSHHHCHRPLLTLFSIPDSNSTFSRNTSRHRSTSIHQAAFYGLRTAQPFSFGFPLSIFVWYAWDRLNWVHTSFWSHVKYLHFDLILIRFLKFA